MRITDQKWWHNWASKGDITAKRRCWELYPDFFAPNGQLLDWKSGFATVTRKIKPPRESAAYRRDTKSKMVNGEKRSGIGSQASAAKKALPPPTDAERPRAGAQSACDAHLDPSGYEEA